MRLLELKSSGELSHTKDYIENIPQYAILSHTWGADDEEVTFEDFITGAGLSKIGYRKINFCREQAARDGLQYIWVDTCCINKANHTELSEAINSMFHWYRHAAKCYVYLADVSTHGFQTCNPFWHSIWKSDLRKSKWFTRAWTLQELIAPTSVEFFTQEGERLGDKRSLEILLHEMTGIPVEVFRGAPLAEFSIEDRMLWAVERTAKRKEDEAYCLLGIFDIHMPLIYGEGRINAFRRLNEVINNRLKNNYSAASAIVRGNVHWMIPYVVNNLFTGRTELLLRIQKALRYGSTSATKKQKRFVITGLGGQGKSEVCLQVASLMREEFWGIFWVDVSKPSTAKRDFIATAKILGRSVENVNEALQVLASTKQSWLLILDNADDLNFDYQDYLPSGNHGTLLITSRVAACKRYSPDAFEALEGLEAEDSKELLLKATELPRESWLLYRSQAEKVAQLLGFHTLALIQAGAYIANGHCQLHQYPLVYQRQREQLLKYRPEQARSRYRDVYTTFEASAEVLEQSTSEAAKDALNLLAVLSTLDSAVLPFEVFRVAWKSGRKFLHTSCEVTNGICDVTQSHVLQLPSFLEVEGTEWDSFRLIEASSKLASLSLVARHDLNGFLGLSMHPVAHAWAKDRQDPAQQGAAWIAAGCTLALYRLESPISHSELRHLLPHIQSYLDVKIRKILLFGPTDVIVPILLNCGWALLDMRQDSRLGHLLQDIFSELSKDPAKVSKELLPLYDLQARSLSNLGKNNRAVELLEQVVQIKETTLAVDHPDRLASQHELASAYETNGQVKEAITLLEHVVQIEETTLAVDHPSRLASQHELASTYRMNGQVKEAITLLEHVVQIKETTLAVDHPSRLASQHTLASAYETNGQVKEAITLLEHVVQIQETTLALDHPDRLASQHTLASAYETNGQVKEAITLLEHVVQIRETTLAVDHPDRLASQHELASAYETNGQVKEAITLLEHVVQISETTLAVDHPSRLASQHTLASAYETNGQVKEAITLLEHVVQIRETTLAVDHPNRLASQHQLAYAYETNGQVKEAVTLLEQVVKIKRLKFHTSHPSRIASEALLSYCLEQI